MVSGAAPVVVLWWSALQNVGHTPLLNNTSHPVPQLRLNSLSLSGGLYGHKFAVSMVQGPGGSGLAGWRWLGTINGREMGSVMEYYCNKLRAQIPSLMAISARLVSSVLSSSQPRPALGGGRSTMPFVEGRGWGSKLRN